MNQHLPILRVQTARGYPVARDGIVICFFMHRSHGAVAHALWRALQTYRRAILPQALSWYADDNGDWQPLDEKGWKHIREEILERRWPAACHIDLEEHCDAPSGYNFEYDGLWLDAPLFYDQDTTCAVTFTLPTEYMVEHGPAHVRALALELARELPFSFGYASFALVAPDGRWFAAPNTIGALRDRYPGLDIYKLRETSKDIGTNARGAYWLTFLGLPLLGRLGGLEVLRRRLPFPEVSLQTLPPLEGERVLVTLSEWPEAIDTEQHERPSPQLLALGHLLEPHLHEERSNWFYFLNNNDRQDMRRWIRRFCP
ncbi:MAG TPA: type VI immunity family protein [Archangium sp.]|uniref:type VI immunity family protein n=1 Tax=Archangium sp. TaxID=1872627 RepID=UPI002E2F980B|nr:type VI immunity family protein [Archangium sp.]HEX5747317.1 type VI immunity family protein [Archangium sp.]